MTTMDQPVEVRDAAPVETAEDVHLAVAACAAILAGVIHLAVVPEHLAESGAAGAFFLLLGSGQLALVLALRWHLHAAIVVCVVVGHLGVIGLYVASRTVDLPFVAPHDAGHSVEHLPVQGGVGNGIPVYPGSRIEPVGPLDVVCLVAEVVLVGMLTGLLPPRSKAVVTVSMAALGLAGVGARVVGLIG